MDQQEAGEGKEEDANLATGKADKKEEEGRFGRPSLSDFSSPPFSVRETLLGAFSSSPPPSPPPPPFPLPPPPSPPPPPPPFSLPPPPSPPPPPPFLPFFSSCHQLLSRRRKEEESRGLSNELFRLPSGDRSGRAPGIQKRKERRKRWGGERKSGASLLHRK